MPVNTGINPSLLRPQTFHVLTYLLGSRILTPLPQRLLCLGVIPAAGAQAAPNTVIPVDDPTQIDTLFATGSNMSLMLRKATETAAQLGSGPALFACAATEPAGVATAETLTITGPATQDGVLVLRIACRYINVGVANGQTATQIAANVVLAIQALYAVLPVTATSAAGVVTCTHTTKGVLGNDVLFDVGPPYGPPLPTGITAVWAQSAAGTLVVDFQNMINTSDGSSFDGIAIANHATADVTEIMTDITAQWAPGTKNPRWYFIGEPGSISTATTLAGAANHEGVVIANVQHCRNLAGEIAASVAVGALSRARPNANYDGMRLPLYPPESSFAYIGTQVETALNAGLTPLTPILNTATKAVIEGICKIERLITSRTTLNSVAFTITRDFGVSRTAWYMATQLDIAYQAKFGALANPDGVLLTDASNGGDSNTMQLIRDMVVNICKAAETILILKQVDTDMTKLVVVQDLQTSGRVDVDLQYTIVVGLHQVAFIHRAQLG